MFFEWFIASNEMFVMFFSRYKSEPKLSLSTKSSALAMKSKMMKNVFKHKEKQMYSAYWHVLIHRYP